MPAWLRCCMRGTSHIAWLSMLKQCGQERVSPVHSPTKPSTFLSFFEVGAIQLVAASLLAATLAGLMQTSVFRLL